MHEDNFIFFDPYPVEQLEELNYFLKNGELSSVIIDTENSYHKVPEFKEINHIFFPVGIFIESIYKKIKGWSEIGDLVNPLVEFMSNQVNSRFENHYPIEVQLNIMPPGTSILKHKDTHPGVGIDYRTHLVLSTNDLVEFIVEDNMITLPQGTCFAFDNSKLHEVHNNHVSLSRTHLIIDFKFFETTPQTVWKPKKR